MAVAETPKTQQADTLQAFKKQGIMSDKPSPRGVVEIPVTETSSVSETISPNNSNSNSSSNEKEEDPKKGGIKGIGGEVAALNPLNYAVHLKGFLHTVKKKSGKLEMPVINATSVSNFISLSSSSCNSTSNEKEEDHEKEGCKGTTGEEVAPVNPLNYAVHLKGFLDTMKKKSGVQKLSNSTIALLSSYDVSAKSLRRKLPRFRSIEDDFDCDLLPIAKRSWRSFELAELEAATGNFCRERMIGKGGHAEVYKGCLPDGTLVAVKRLIKKSNKDDEERSIDFLAELGIIAHVEHPNTAKLIGFGVEGGLYLVLQFAPHGSVASSLQGSREGLDWKTRFNIAVGVAEGLSYLHHTCPRRIIHRDIKASNILLSEDYEPLISDFGLAKWLPDKWLHHVVFPIEGTFGYLAPEYFMHGIADEKTDTFAYGVLLLELITGREAVGVDSGGQSLVKWAKPHLDSNNLKEIADPRLGGDYDPVEMKRAMVTASMCVRHTPNRRPFMKKVVRLLKGEGVSIDQMKQKSITPNSILLDACDVEDYTSLNYLEDLNRHRELVME